MCAWEHSGIWGVACVCVRHLSKGHAAIHAGIVTMCHLSTLPLWLWPVWSAVLDDSVQPSPLKPLLGLHSSKVGGWGVNPTVCLCSKLCKLLLGVIGVCRQFVSLVILPLNEVISILSVWWGNGVWCAALQCACSVVRYSLWPTEYCVLETSKGMDGVWLSSTVDSHGWQSRLTVRVDSHGW